jgi:hypothetical protein
MAFVDRSSTTLKAHTNHSMKLLILALLSYWTAGRIKKICAPKLEPNDCLHVLPAPGIEEGFSSGFPSNGGNYEPVSYLHLRYPFSQSSFLFTESRQR